MGPERTGLVHEDVRTAKGQVEEGPRRGPSPGGGCGGGQGSGTLRNPSVGQFHTCKCRPKTPMHFKAYTKLVPNSEVWDTLSPKQLCPALASEGHGVFYTSKSETRVAYALKSGTFWSTL